MSTAEQPFELTRLDGAERPEFNCGDADIDEFYHKDSIDHAAELVCVTYAWLEEGRPKAFFSVSNDAIIKDLCPPSAFKRLLSKIPRDKRYSSMPAVKIGRLGVAKNVQRSGFGSRIMGFLKVWFTHKNKTGCRFILVDAYNNASTIAFYQKNGFQFLTGKDEKEETRIMYFDLIPFANRATAS